MQDKQLTVICDSSCNFMDSEVNARLAELGLGNVIAYESVPLSIIRFRAGEPKVLTLG